MNGIEQQEIFNTNGFINQYGPLIILALIVVILLMVTAILKLKAKNKNPNAKNVIGFLARFFSNNKAIQEAINQAFNEASKGEADLNKDGIVTKEEFEEYLTKKVSKKAYKIIARTKIGLFISEKTCMSMVTLLLDSIIKENETSLEELFNTAKSWDETAPEEDLSPNEDISTENNENLMIEDSNVSDYEDTNENMIPSTDLIKELSTQNIYVNPEKPVSVLRLTELQKEMIRNNLDPTIIVISGVPYKKISEDEYIPLREIEGKIVIKTGDAT